MHFFHSVGASKNQQQNTRPLTVNIAGEIFQHVLANQFLRRAMTGVRFRYDCLRIALCQFSARRKHASAHQVEPCPRNQPPDHPAGARFAHRIGSNDGVGKFFGLHVDLVRLKIKPRFMQRNRSRQRLRERSRRPSFASNTFSIPSVCCFSSEGWSG